MATDDGRPFTLRDLQTYGTPEQVRAFEAGRQSVTEGDHEHRLRALEVGQASLERGQITMQTTLDSVKTEAHATRIEQNAVLNAIVVKVEAISAAQTLETGRKLGSEAATATALEMARRGEDKRDGWAKTALPWVMAILAMALAGYMASLPGVP